jgi:hypothetical protein
MNQDCCEYADWFIADTPQDKRPKPRREGTPDLEGFVFDTAFFDRILGGDFDGGGIAVFRIINGQTEKFIHIFNVQNGYYSHGFNFTSNTETIRNGRL